MVNLNETSIDIIKSAMKYYHSLILLECTMGEPDALAIAPQSAQCYEYVTDGNPITDIWVKINAYVLALALTRYSKRVADNVEEAMKNGNEKEVGMYTEQQTIIKGLLEELPAV